MGIKLRNLAFIILVGSLLIFIATNESVVPWLRNGIEALLLGSGAALWAYVLLVLLKGE